MSYEKLKETKFFENYQKALRKEIPVETVKTIKTNEKVVKYEELYNCSNCGIMLINRVNGKYIFSEELNASFLKEIRIKCICGKVNTFKR